MKRLTIGRIAAANLRNNRRSYLSMALGIVLAVMMITSMCLLAQGIVLKMQADVQDKVGEENGMLLAADDVTDDAMMATGMFTNLAHVTNYASVADTNLYIGCYDDAAWMMLHRRFLAGRAPQSEDEIAMEQMALYRLGLDNTQVGDTITLTMADAEGNPTGETRTYTLCGILVNQSENLKAEYYSSMYKGKGYCTFPSLITAPQNQYSGTTFLHILFQRNGFVSERTIDEYVTAHFGRSYCVFVKSNGQLQSGNMSVYENNLGLTNEASQLIIILLILGLSIVLAAGIGIATAMESQLARKTEEIGMLRAVGATRRQIRRIFGREAWLLTLVLSPVSVGLGMLAAWIVARFVPDKIIFSPTPAILLPVLLFTAIMMLASSYLPLRRVSAIAPMQVLKDAATMRKARRFKAKKQFKTASLLSWRQIRLHPTRQLGAAVMVAIMLLFVFGMTVSYYAISGENPLAYALQPKSHDGYGLFTQIRYADALSGQSLQELAHLPQVSAVQEQRTLQVQSTSNHMGEYILGPNGHLFSWYVKDDVQQSQEAKDIRALLGLEQNEFILTHVLVVCTDVNALHSCIAEGQIDIAALDEGREVLIYMPEIWIDEVRISDYEWTGQVSRKPLRRYSDHYVNDQYHPGDTMQIFQLISDSFEEFMFGEANVADMELHQANVRIGAVLTGPELPGINGYFGEGTIITTPKGLQALGFWNGNQNRVVVELSGELDAATEAFVTQEVNRIAMRGDMTVYNYIESHRESHENTVRGRITLAAVILLFFAVSVSMIVTGVTRRLQSDRRAIGTLRAVGVDAGVIFRCYAGQALLGVGIGAVLGVASGYLLTTTNVYYYYGMTIWPVYLMQLCIAALCGACCLGILWLRVKRMVLNQPIVEMIKEL